MLASLAFALAVKPAIVIDLLPIKKEFAIGEAVKFTAPAKNVSPQSILLVPQGDSMQSGRKAPTCQLQFRQLGSQEWQVPQLPAGCGNTNPARPEDFVEVKPGASINLLGDMSWSVHEIKNFATAPGTYEFRLLYDTSRSLDQWIGGPLVEEQHTKALEVIGALHSQVPVGRFISKTTRIRLVQAPD